MHRTLRAAVMLAAVLLTGAGPRAQPTTLQLRPLLDAGGGFSAMDVVVAFDGEADGETVLELPDEWGGETELYAALSDLRAQGATIAPGADLSKRVLRHAPRARIVVRYRVGNAAADEHRGRNDYRPLIKPTHFQLFGTTYIALPEGTPESAPAAFAIDGMPAGAAFASDLQHARRGAPLTVQDLTDSVSVGGDFRVLDAGGGVRIAIRGAWSRDDVTWRTQVSRIGASQRAYWGADTEPYLVTVLPLSLPPENISVGGTGLSDAFAFFATPNARPEQIDTTLGHEMMHTWVPRRIGRLDETNEQLHYWLSEGFTEFASFRTNVRGGLWSPEEFAAAFNASLKAYDLSPARTASNARILAAFWQDEAVQKLPYQRGLLLATLWDYRVRAATGGRRDLDDVLLEMQEVARRRGDASADRILPIAMRRVGQVELGVDLTTLVGEGAVVPLPEDLFAPCGRIVTTPQRLWERGFDFDATRRADWKIAGVVEGSNAYAAGLRNGMDLRRWSERSDDRVPDRPASAGVRDNGVERTLTWLPAGREVRDVRALVLDPAMDRDACIARLSGR